MGDRKQPTPFSGQPRPEPPPAPPPKRMDINVAVLAQAVFTSHVERCLLWGCDGNGKTCEYCGRPMAPRVPPRGISPIG
jgi:hypothetical protein